MTSAQLTSSLWYLARGTGVVTLLLLTLVVALGIATRSGRPLPGLPRFAVAAVHRSASLLTIVLLTVHITTLMFDPYAQLKLLDVLLPFGASYRPLWVGLGTLASDLMIALVVTSLLRGRIGARAWRAVHWLAYAAWPVALLHGLGSGTDSGRIWLRALSAGSVLAVSIALAWRLAPSFGRYAGAGFGARIEPVRPSRPLGPSGTNSRTNSRTNTHTNTRTGTSTRTDPHTRAFEEISR